MRGAVLSENTASEVVTDGDKERERPFVFSAKRLSQAKQCFMGMAVGGDGCSCAQTLSLPPRLLVRRSHREKGRLGCELLVEIPSLAPLLPSR